MSLFHELTVIDPGTTTASPAAVLAGPVEGDLVLTGPDALAWLGMAMVSPGLGFAAWPSAEEPITVFGSFTPSQEGVLVLVAGGGIGPDGADLQPSWSRPSEELSAFLGTDVVQVDDTPAAAAARLCGPPDAAAGMLDLVGATAVILAGRASSVASELAGHVDVGLGGLDLPVGRLLSCLAWTRGLGSFRLGGTAPDPGPGPTATLLTGPAAARRANELLAEGSAFDVVAAARHGGTTGPATDLATGLGPLGTVLLTGGAVPERPVIVLRGDLAAAARRLVPAPPPHGLVVGPAPAEDRERHQAHQWAAAQRRARSAKETPSDAGGPTLLTEGNAVGYPTTRGAVGAGLLAAIGSARGWREIDPSLPPLLDPVLAHARRQVRGDDAPVPAAALAALATRAGEPGFWENLLSSTEPGTGERLVFGYPAPAVELLRAVVAAEGDAGELRRLLGPVKVSILGAFGGIA